VPLEATLAVCVGFNMALALLIVAYIVSLRVNPDDFRWLQPKAKVRSAFAFATTASATTKGYHWSVPTQHSSRSCKTGAATHRPNDSGSCILSGSLHHASALHMCMCRPAQTIPGTYAACDRVRSVDCLSHETHGPDRQ